MARFEIRRVHGWKTYRVMDTVKGDWDGPAMATKTEAEEHCAYMENYWETKTLQARADMYAVENGLRF